MFILNLQKISFKKNFLKLIKKLEFRQPEPVTQLVGFIQIDGFQYISSNLFFYSILKIIGIEYRTLTGLPCCFPGSILGNNLITLIASSFNFLCGALA